MTKQTIKLDSILTIQYNFHLNDRYMAMREGEMKKMFLSLRNTIQDINSVKRNTTGYLSN